jgi:hypothetical protein
MIFSRLSAMTLPLRAWRSRHNRQNGIRCKAGVNRSLFQSTQVGATAAQGRHQDEKLIGNLRLWHLFARHGEALDSCRQSRHYIWSGYQNRQLMQPHASWSYLLRASQKTHVYFAHEARRGIPEPGVGLGISSPILQYRTSRLLRDMGLHQLETALGPTRL